MDPESLPDYVALGAAAEVTSVEELQDPEWMKQLQDELDALEVSIARIAPASCLWGTAGVHHEACMASDQPARLIPRPELHSQDEAAALKERLNITTAATQHGVPGKTGPAKQVLPDDHFLVKLNVREAFMDCSDRARQRNANRKMTSLRALSSNDGRFVTYSRSARAKLNPALTLRIRCVCIILKTSPAQARHAQCILQRDLLDMTISLM